jgi:Anti-anti-sigma regulatory factor (antagonist of anti-sigma factor)
MDSSQIALTRLYRQIIRSIVIDTLIISIVAFVVTLAAYLITQNTLILVILTIAGITAIGCGLILFLLARNSQLWQAIAAFGVMVIACEVAVAVWLPELSLSVIPFLAIVILLAGLQGQRTFSILILLICVGVAALILTLNQLTKNLPIEPNLLTFLEVSSIVALFIDLWAFLDRIFAAQMQALYIADQRAEEAEAARNTAEAARQEIERRALEQQRLLELVAVLELPVLTIDERVLLVPLVGHLDSRRAEALRQRVLKVVAERRAQAVIIDVSGITIIDTAVARALIDTATAIRLLGARTLISGIGPAVAQTLVHLNIGLEEVVTAPNPEAALRLARATVGV